MVALMPALRLALMCACLAGLTACQNPGDTARPDVYSQTQVNTRQKAEVVNILAIMPAKVQVDNAQNKQTAQLVGGLMGAVGGGVIGGVASRGHVGATALGATGGGIAGAAAGSLVPGQVLVDGVSITFEEHGQTFTSAQVGKLCEYQAGRAVMIETSPSVTRVQPNATCPPPKA